MRAIDGDTIRLESGRPDVRLVGYDTPEVGGAECTSERDLGLRARARLGELVAAGGLNLEYIQCSCRPGTHGTDACNFGRDCARARFQGRDVADIMISEGLGDRFVCGATDCPPQRQWCPAAAHSSSAPRLLSSGGGNPFRNCAAARAAGSGPVFRGQPGYGQHLDRDNDGIGCEWN
jgi:endonuclease YncB( thermonuclease family)